MCPHCGQPEYVEILEVWGHEFQLDTCCEGTHEEAVAFMNDDQPGASQWLRAKLADVLPGGPALRRIADDGVGGLVLDFHPEIEEITLADVRQFVNQHHRHCDGPVGWRFGCAVSNGGSLTRTRVGVLSAGRPVARMLDQSRIVEVNRLCIDPSLPQALVWNVASQMYGWAARKARALGAEWIVTYTLASEEGTSLLAAGWEPDHVTVGRAWDSSARPRETRHTGDKIRWRKKLVPRPGTELRGNAGEALKKWGRSPEGPLRGRDLVVALKHALEARPRRSNSAVPAAEVSRSEQLAGSRAYA